MVAEAISALDQPLMLDCIMHRPNWEMVAMY